VRRRRSSPHVLRAWVLLRLPLPVLLLVLVPGAAGALLAAILTNSDYGHSLAKNMLAPWFTMIYQAPVLPWVLLAALALAVVLPSLGARAWLGVVLAATGLGLLLVTGWPGGILLLAALLALNCWPTVPAAVGRLAWVPGTEFVFPGPVLRVVGVPTRVATGIAAAWLVGAWFVTDAVVTADVRAAAVGAWPASRLDPRIRVLARADPSARSEFQDIDVTPERVIVVAETSSRLLAFPRDLVGAPAWTALQPQWGADFGLTLDSETDRETGTTWFVDGPRHIKAVRWVGDHAEILGSSVDLPRHISHAYTRYSAERKQLMLIPVNVVEELDPPAVILVDTPGLDHAVTHPLKTKDGQRVPHIRDIEWMPSVGKLALAPDFGSWLYLADPDTGLSEPWLNLPTLNGRMVWSPTLERLFLAMPNQFAVVVANPATGEIERRIPTQPGVRPLAIDAERGLLITASVATGMVLVQRLDTGAYVDSFRTVMPMVREMTLMQEEGVVILSTWTQLYAIPYAVNAQ